jgi:hypothetical protein
MSTRGKYLIAFLAIAIPSLSWYFFASKNNDDVVQAQILSIGFSPLNPPADLLVPGSFFYTNIAGTRLQTVCHADETQVRTLLIPERVSSSVEDLTRNGTFTLGGQLLDMVNANRQANLVESISLEFSDAEIVELDGPALAQIEANLFKQGCNTSIDNWYDYTGLICQAQSALVATIKFDIKRKDGSQITSDADVAEVKQSIEQALNQGKAVGSGGVEAEVKIREMVDLGASVQGVALVYGVRFKPKCVFKPDESPIIFPTNRMDKFVLEMRRFYQRNQPF